MQQSDQQSHFRAKSRNSQSQSSADWCAACLLAAKRWPHTWQLRPALHRLLSCVMICVWLFNWSSVRPLHVNARRASDDRQVSNVIAMFLFRLAPGTSSLIGRGAYPISFSTFRTSFCTRQNQTEVGHQMVWTTFLCGSAALRPRGHVWRQLIEGWDSQERSKNAKFPCSPIRARLLEARFMSTAPCDDVKHDVLNVMVEGVYWWPMSRGTHWWLFLKRGRCRVHIYYNRWRRTSYANMR